MLRWTTASETNNSGFVVQHAVDRGSFAKAGWVDGAGTTTQEQSYQFSVEDLSTGTHHFRLKQVDLDGTTSQTEPVTVTVPPEGPIEIKRLAPQPIQSTGTLAFVLDDPGPVTVALYDVLGRQVKTLHQGYTAAHQSVQVSLNTASLSGGTYFLRIEGDSFTHTSQVAVTP